MGAAQDVPASGCGNAGGRLAQGRKGRAAAHFRVSAARFFVKRCEPGGKTAAVFGLFFGPLSTARSTKRVRKTASVFSDRSLRACFFARAGLCQATAVWRWGNYRQTRDPPDQPRVRVNVDETSLRLVTNEGQGHVTETAYRLHVAGRAMGRRASLAKQRSTVTHLAAICDSAEIHQVLPQLVLVGE